VREQVQQVLDQVRIHLQAEGGDVELVDVDDQGNVKVRLQGACKGCPGAMMTLRHGIERALKEAVPEVKTVEAVP
jgi:Fe-S cluster biogenesis protein NfuA